MEPLVINSTDRTPAITLDPKTGSFVITGRSLTEDTSKFYKPILDWFEKYMQNPNLTNKIVFQMEYFNTSSSRVYMMLIKQLEKLHMLGYKASVEWHYDADDFDILEAGNDYSSMVQLPFVFITIEQ